MSTPMPALDEEEAKEPSIITFRINSDYPKIEAVAAGHYQAFEVAGSTSQRLSKNLS